MICCLYKETRTPPFHPRLLLPLLIHSRAPTPTFDLLRKNIPNMSGAGGKWMCSSIKKEDIKKLREAGYLSKDIAHRLPTEGQIIPTPEPHERVVFIPHFVSGLGFPLHQFVQELMFYYRVDFHDLAPTPSLTSRHLLSCVRPSSASHPTSDCG